MAKALSGLCCPLLLGRPEEALLGLMLLDPLPCDCCNKYVSPLLDDKLLLPLLEEERPLDEALAPRLAIIARLFCRFTSNNR